ncbi:protein kinase PINOID-like [Lolium perenne]|uniref:protein kinase PINOID-like n=1 Tax=Lolium perenne TaxID=4522 RepID=UPI0021F6359E|nr:protein kinase PINOID-like [Lolium perenne]
MVAAVQARVPRKPPAREKAAEGMPGALSSPPVAEEGLSDLETASSTGAPNSSLSSTSSAGSVARCSSLSRLSFDCTPSAAVAAAASCSPRPVAPFRPHRSGDVAWAAIRALSASSSSPATPLGPADFKLVRRVGAGDIGTVYLCRLRTATPEEEESSHPCCLYAMKVVDRRLVAKKRKLERAAAERRILRLLDHPFLPTLFADFDAAPRFSCVVTEFCPGGDLHSLRHRMPSRRFPPASARFYAAEVLLALEYLHMMGVVYRDLKPENVLIRADGHIMLTDFDLSLESTSSPSLLLPAPAADDDEEEPSAASCFPLRFRRRQRRPRRCAASLPPRFVAEPVAARSSSFVGTHEYVAPEVASGGAHGAAVDWWAYGVFLYELLHGRTPFAGATNEDTLRNIVRSPLAFPVSTSGSAISTDMAAARDLITRLLNKDPAARLGSLRGAADVKAHPFFKNLNFALLRSSRPPVVPGAPMHRSQSCKAPASRKPDPRFDLF